LNEQQRLPVVQSNKFELVEQIQCSTSQWIALLTGVAAALYYRRGLDLAVADPVSAADLGEGVPALLEAEAAAERGETPGGADEEVRSIAQLYRNKRTYAIGPGRAAGSRPSGSSTGSRPPIPTCGARPCGSCRVSFTGQRRLASSCLPSP